MKKGTCPKCQSNEVFNKEFGGISTHGDSGFYLYADVTWFTIQTYICGNCGYAEQFCNTVSDNRKKENLLVKLKGDKKWIKKNSSEPLDNI